MPFDPSLYRRRELSRALFDSLSQRARKHESLRLMEFCGTHTHNIFQYGFRYAFAPHIRFIAGPGCPVCVTAEEELRQAVKLFDRGVGLVIYGDLARVPVDGKSLTDYRAEGHAIEVVYSAYEAVDLAAKFPDRDWVFLGVGFETTIPATALAVTMGRSRHVSNLSVLSFHKNTRAILGALGASGRIHADGVLLPGHVSAVVGSEYFAQIRELGIPAVVVGFEPVDILVGIHRLLDMIERGERGIVCAYERAVDERGNVRMMQAVNEVFRIADAPWRGLGAIPDGGYELRDEFSAFNARVRYGLPPAADETPAQESCRCGEVLIGAIEPPDCPFFGTSCVPENPFGPCMVSHEGTCLAYYRWRNSGG